MTRRSLTSHPAARCLRGGAFARRSSQGSLIVRIGNRMLLLSSLTLALAIVAPAPAQARDAHWVAAWGTSLQGAGAATDVVTNETVRMIVRPTATGAFVRVRLENTFGTPPLTVGSATIAVRNNG